MNNFKDNLLAKTLAIILSVVMCVTMLPASILAEGESTPANKTIDEIVFPEYAGIVARDFYIPNSGEGAINLEQVKTAVLENAAVKEKLTENKIDENSIEVIIEGNELNEATNAVASGDFKRTPQLKDVTIKLKSGDKTSNAIKVKVFYFRPPFDFPNGEKQFMSSSSLVGLGKLVVDNPNKYTLTGDQIKIAKDRFLAANKDLVSENDISVSDQGVATITLNGQTMEVPSDYFVSPIGRVPNFWVFKNPNENKGFEIGANEGKTIEVPVKEGVKLTNVGHIKNPTSTDKEAKGLTVTYDETNNKIKITGAVTEGGGRIKSIGARFVIQANFGSPARVLSNVIRVHCIYTDDNTLIRNVDEEKEHVDAKGEQLIKSLNPHTKGIAWSGDNSFGNIEGYDYDKPETAGDINGAIKKDITKALNPSINVQNLKHQVGYQDFDVNMTTPQGQKSQGLKAKLIYYTKKIPVTVVANQTQLNENEKNAIIDKVKKANGYNENNNKFDVKVGNDGRVTLKYKVKDGNLVESNGTKKKEVTIDLGRPVQQFQFKDSEVKPGGSVAVEKPAQLAENSTTELKKDKDGNLVKVPEGTTYEPTDASITKEKDGSFTVPVAYGDNKKVNVKVIPQTDGTLKFEVPKDAPTNTTIDVPVKVKVPEQQDGVVITAKVHILSPDKDLYKPKADKVEKNYGVAPTEKEVFSKISLDKEDNLPTDIPTPNPTSDKMKSFALKQGTNLPDGKTSGKFNVSVVVTYEDGSEDEVTVPVIVGPKAPKVEAKEDGSVEITPDDTNSTEMTIKYTPEGEGATETTLTVKKENGQWSLPQGTEGITIDATSGKVTIPENKVKDKFDVKATNKMKLDEKEYPSEVAKATAKKPKPGYANIKYVLQADFNKSPKVITEIDAKFKPDNSSETTHPTKLKGKNGTKIKLTDFDLGKNNANAPKFIGYTFKVAASSGDLGNYNTDLTKAGTIYLTYEKLDEIIPAEGNATCPDGYVVVTFKDADGAKVNDKDDNVKFYVNKKAGVKVELDNGKYYLVGKDSNNTDLKKEVPTVTADQGYELDYHKPSETETTTWAYDNYEKVNKPITEATDFTAKVKTNIKEPKKTFIKDPKNLTKEEKDAVKKAVEDANKGEDGKSTLPQDATITVDENGNVTIKKGDTEIAKLTPDKTIFTVNPPEKTYVKDPKNLTKEEKEKVKKAVEDKNKDDKGNSTLPKGSVIEVKDDGTAVIKDKEGKEITTLTPDETITSVKSPKKTIVKDPKNLTQEEKEKVKKAVEDVNKDDKGNSTLPKGSVIEVKDDGTVIIKDKDGDDGKEIDRVPADKTITTLKAPEKTLVKNPTKLTDIEKDTIKDKIKKANPDLPDNYTITVNDDGSVVITDDKNKEFGKFTPEETIITNELPAPSIDPIYETDEVVTGKAEPNATVTVIFPPQYEGDKPVVVTTIADRDGNYMVDVPYEVELREFDKVYAYQELDGVKSKDTVTEVRYDDYYDRRQYDHRDEEPKEEPKAEPKKPAKPIRVWTPEKLNASEHKSYIKGYPDGTFGPAKTITRAEVAMIFGRLSLVKDANNALGFKDIKQNDWFKKAVDIVSKQGIVKGYEDGEFKPNRPITRREFAAIIGRYAKNMDAWKTFKDVKPTDWAYQAINKAAGMGWINGYEDGTFRPDNLITRAEVVAIVNRMLNRSADSVFVDTMLYKNAIKNFTDVLRNAWYFYDIYEASVGHEFTRKEDGKSENWTKVTGKEFSLNY